MLQIPSIRKNKKAENNKYKLQTWYGFNDVVSFYSHYQLNKSAWNNHRNIKFI